MNEPDETTISLTTTIRCPDCGHSTLQGGMGGICIGCACPSKWHSEQEILQREIDAKHVPLPPT